jgi:HTH-type transcriptional regulator/antitoxin HigA
MGKKNRYNPDAVSPPGATLKDALELHGMSQAEFCRVIGRPTKTINEIIKGKAAITAGTAIQFENALGIPAEFWVQREATYRLNLERLKRKRKKG